MSTPQRDHQLAWAVLQSMTSLVLGLDESQRVVVWSPGAETVLGVAARDAVGRPLAEVPLDWDVARVSAALDRCATRGRASVELPLGSAGRILGLGITRTAPVGGGELQFLVQGADITEKLRLQRELTQAHKLESLGQLAAGVAHELNSPVQFLGDGLFFLQESASDVMALVADYQELRTRAAEHPALQDLSAELAAREDEVDLELLNQELPAVFERTQAGIQRVTTIVRAMLDFAAPTSVGRVPTDLNRTLRSTLEVARPRYRDRVRIVLDLGTLPKVTCSPSEVGQVFLNLLLNAAQAIEDTPRGRGTLRISSRRSGGERVTFVFEDDGCGIPAEVQRRVFDPFFTTRAVGQGRGQGLSASLGIAEGHGGTLRLTSEVGKGTTFTLQLPVEPAEAPGGP